MFFRVNGRCHGEMKEDRVVLFFARNVMILYRIFFFCSYCFLRVSIVLTACYIFLFLLREYEDEFNYVMQIAIDDSEKKK